MITVCAQELSWYLNHTHAHYINHSTKDQGHRFWQVTAESATSLVEPEEASAQVVGRMVHPVLLQMGRARNIQTQRGLILIGAVVLCLQAQEEDVAEAAAVQRARPRRARACPIPTVNSSSRSATGWHGEPGLLMHPFTSTTTTVWVSQQSSIYSNNWSFRLYFRDCSA